MSEQDLWAVVGRNNLDLDFNGALRNDFSKALRDHGYTLDSEEMQKARVATQWIPGSPQNMPPRLQQKQIDAAEETWAIASDMKKGLRDTINQIDRAYSATMLMYEVTFYLGVALILMSAIGVYFFKEPMLSAIFGGLGVADIVAFLVTNPPERLQNSRASLAQLQGTLFYWFTDFVNWNTYLGQIAQQKGAVSFDDLKNVSNAYKESTADAMKTLQQYCKLLEMDGKSLRKAQTSKTES